MMTLVYKNFLENVMRILQLFPTIISLEGIWHKKGEDSKA